MAEIGGIGQNVSIVLLVDLLLTGYWDIHQFLALHKRWHFRKRLLLKVTI